MGPSGKSGVCPGVDGAELVASHVVGAPDRGHGVDEDVISVSCCKNAWARLISPTKIQHVYLLEKAPEE